MITTENLHLFDKENLRSALEELLHNMKHLEISQYELSDALVSSPEDKDFIQAIEENMEILMKKRKLVISIHELLLKKDPLYREEPFTHNEILRTIVTKYTDQLSVNVVHDDGCSRNADNNGILNDDNVIAASTLAGDESQARHDNDGLYL